MSLLKFINRLKRIDDLIRSRRTGSACEFADKVGISRSMLMENLRDMRELGARIEYSPLTRSYYYENDFELIVGESKKNKIRGGVQYFDRNNLSDYKLFTINKF